MARVKKTSSHYEKAVVRLASLKSIDANLDLGNGLTVAGYEQSIKSFRSAVDDYNSMLSQLDLLLNKIQESEKGLQDLSERMLTGVATKYGKNSNEYEQAGGTKKSERKKPKKTKPE